MFLKSITALALTLTLALTQSAQATDSIWRTHVPKDIEVQAGYRPFLADQTNFIQRLNTVGGKGPATPCTEALLNTRQLVNYEADYYFYTKERTHR
jgi:hypothetical protein